MNRIFHHYEDLECLKAGLLKSGIDNSHVKSSIELLSNPQVFYERAKKMLIDFHKSAEHNLTNNSINRNAWIGQATCLHNHSSNMDETIQAWVYLGESQQDEANNIAKQILREWIYEQAGEQCQKNLWG